MPPSAGGGGVGVSLPGCSVSTGVCSIGVALLSGDGSTVCVAVARCVGVVVGLALSLSPQATRATQATTAKSTATRRTAVIELRHSVAGSGYWKQLDKARQWARDGE